MARAPTWPTLPTHAHALPTPTPSPRRLLRTPCAAVRSPHSPHPLRRRRRYARYRGMALSALPVPVGSGSKLDVEDTEQEVSLKINVVHSVLDAAQAPEGFLLSGDQAAAIAAAQAARPVAAEEEASAPPAAGGGAASNQPQDVEDGSIVLE